MALPLVLHPSHFFYTGSVRTPPGTDIFTTLWRMWWIKVALRDGYYPFQTDFVLYPVGLKFFLEQAIIASDFVTAPLVGLIPLTSIHSGLFIASMALSGFGCFLLVQYLIKDTASAFVAGCIFAFTPFKFAHIDHLTVFSFHWLPFFTLFFLKLLRESPLRNAFYAACFFSLACFTDLNMGPFMVILGVIIVLEAWLFNPLFEWNRSLIKKFFAFVGFVFAFVGPYGYFVLLAYFQHKASDGVAVAIDSKVSQSLDLLSFFIPSFLHPLFGNWVEPYYAKVATFDGKKISGYCELVGYLGVVATSLVILGMRTVKKTERRLWAFILFFFFVLALGPVLKVVGLFSFSTPDIGLSEFAKRIDPGLDPIALEMMRKQVGIPMPYLLFHFLPIFKAHEAPARFFILGLLGVCVLAGWGVTALKKRVSWQPKWLVLALVVPIGFEYYSLPRSISEVMIPDFYTRLSLDKEMYAIIDLPLFEDLPQEDPRHAIRKKDPLYNMNASLAMYYQTVHGKKIVTGAPDRRPTSLYAFIEETPFMNRLAHPERIELIGERISSHALKDRQIRYVVLHRNRISEKNLMQLSAFLERGIEDHGLRKPFHTDNEVTVYKIY